MAFEDRCSPNQANSPGPDPNKTPSPDATNLNPNDRHLKPYTCNIITKHERSSPIDGMKSGQIFYSPYYAGYYNIYDPLNQYLIQKAPSLESRERSPQRDERPMDLNFSISNILRPEFGLTAIKKTTNKKEGPRSGGPTQSILYKPYELKIDRAVQKVDLPNAPLGKLSRTVASIAQTKKEDFPARVSREEFGFSKADTVQKRPDSANSSISTASSSVSSQGVARGAGGYVTGSDDGSTKSLPSTADKSGNQQWPAWVFCTRYSDRPSSGPRSRRSKKKETSTVEDKRPRTAFSGSQLARLKQEFTENRYLTERRRQQLSSELGLNEAQIKIWFQNKRAKIKKSSGQKHPLALQLMAQGLYNHTTASGSEDEDEISVT